MGRPGLQRYRQAGGSPVGPESQMALDSSGGNFQGAGFLGSCGDLWLLLDNNYSRTITNITAEAQSTRRTNEWRLLLLRSSALFFEYGCCRRPGPGHARGRRPWAGPSGACGAVIRADRLAWKAIVPEGL